MATNFLQWNPNGVNQEDDTAYAGDGLRSAGAPANAIFPSPTANKAFYQFSTFITAFATMLVAKGYSPDDGSANPPTSIPNLAGVLANIMTQADMTPFALLASPTFTGDPKAPTPAPGDNDQSIATTAFVQAAIAGAIAVIAPLIATVTYLPDSPGNYTKAGYIQFTAPLGGLKVLWWIGPQDAATEFSITRNFPVAFATACFQVQLTYGNTIDTASNDAWYQVISFTNSTVKYRKQGTGGTDQVSNGYFLAIGH